GQQTNVGTVTGQDANNPPGPGVRDDNPANYFGDAADLADVAVSKMVTPPQVAFGATAVFTLVVRNNGPDAATRVAVTDPLPPGLVFVSAAPSQGTVSPGGDLWVVGGLAPGATAVLQVTAQVAAVGPISNTAFVRADQADPDLANNRDSAV